MNTSTRHEQRDTLEMIDGSYPVRDEREEPCRLTHFPAERGQNVS
jgi:hypothetical protein